MPEAEVDDGQLDMVILSPKGVVGWAAVAARLASKKRKGHQIVDHYTSRVGAASAPTARRRSRSTATPSARPGPSPPRSCPAPSSSGWVARLMATSTLTAWHVPAAARLARGAVAMVLFAVPVLLLGFAVRQKFDPLIRLDNDLIRSATDLTRTHGRGRRAARAPGRSASRSCSTSLAHAGRAVGLAGQGAAQPRPVGVRHDDGRPGTSACWPSSLVGRARPVVDDPISHSPGLLVPVGPRVQRRGRRHGRRLPALAAALDGGPRRVARGVAVVFALAVGLDRIFLGVHFPSDVLAGYVLGVGITFSSWLGFIGKTAATSSPGPSHPA